MFGKSLSSLPGLLRPPTHRSTPGRLLVCTSGGFRSRNSSRCGRRLDYGAVVLFRRCGERKCGWRSVRRPGEPRWHAWPHLSAGLVAHPIAVASPASISGLAGAPCVSAEPPRAGCVRSSRKSAPLREVRVVGGRTPGRCVGQTHRVGTGSREATVANKQIGSDMSWSSWGALGASAPCHFSWKPSRGSPLSGSNIGNEVAREFASHSALEARIQTKLGAAWSAASHFAGCTDYRQSPNQERPFGSDTATLRRGVSPGRRPSTLRPTNDARRAWRPREQVLSKL